MGQTGQTAQQLGATLPWTLEWIPRMTPGQSQLCCKGGSGLRGGQRPSRVTQQGSGLHGQWYPGIDTRPSVNRSQGGGPCGARASCLLPSQQGRWRKWRKRCRASAQSPFLGEGLAVRRPQQLQWPLQELPAGMPELGLLEGLVLCFHYLARPWRRSAGCLGSAEFTYLHGSSALSVELKESGSSVGGLLTAAWRLRPAGKWAGGGAREDQGGAVPCVESALFWLDPEKGLGKQGCRLLGS